MIPTVHLFAELDGLLLDLLRSLSREEWELPTVSPRWNVRQVAAHLLDTPLRRLSFVRDGWPPPAPRIRSDADLAAWVNEMNRQGVEVFGRLSPPLLIAFMETAARELREYLTALDPLAPAAWPVSWAGERKSENWFDIARELTERWHHQQQIREALERSTKPGIMTRRLFHPVLDTFMRALPRAYRDVAAPQSAVARVVIAGDCGGEWFLERQGAGWALVPRAPAERVVATTAIPQEIAWRVFTKGISSNEAAARTTFEGDPVIARAALAMVAIVA